MKPLENLTVLDLSRALAGPYCTLMLADMGADVIKIEQPGSGDDSRGWGPPFLNGESAYFLSINRNKRSITLNLKEKEGKEIFYKLAKDADVVIENFRPGTTEKLGIDFAKISEINERIIYCSISGFGQDGPYRYKPGYDLILQGMGGLMTMTGEEGGAPIKIGVAITDIAAGMFGAYGVVLALFNREKTKKGQYIDISMLDCQVSWLTYQAGAFFATGDSPRRLGSAHPTIVPYQAFKTQTGYINVAVGSEKLWSSFCEALGHEALAENPDYKTNRDRVKNRDILIPLLQQIIAEKSTEEWLQVLDDHGVPAGPIYTFNQIFSDPQVLHRNMLVEMDHPTAGRIKQTGVQIKLSETPGALEHPPPLLGEHTEEILSHVGYSPESIKILKESGII